MKKACLLYLFSLLAASIASAENWQHWRGPNYNGTSPETGLPTEFSKTENIKWSVKMPGASAATPIVWDDHVFVTSADPDSGSSLAMAFDRRTGNELWRKSFPGIRKDNRSNYAAPSPVTDGIYVYFFFGNGPLACYDFRGKEIWTRNIAEDYGDFAFGWTFSTSPLLHDGKLYLQVLQRDEPVSGRGLPNAESYLLALDPGTGEEIFRHVRPSKAKMESREAFTSPIPFTHEGREEILIVGGDALSGHDPDTGEEYWRWGTWNPDREPFWRLVPSPVAGDGVILACGPKKNPIFAVEAGLEGTHTGDSAVAWVSDPSKEVPLTTDVSTPLFYEDRFYVLASDARALLCVEPETGKVIYSQRLDSRDKLESSPTAADGKIYMMNHLGDVFVVKAGDEFEQLHYTEMGESMQNISRACISISQGNLFIRTDTHLFCVGE